MKKQRPVTHIQLKDLIENANGKYKGLVDFHIQDLEDKDLKNALKYRDTEGETVLFMAVRYAHHYNSSESYKVLNFLITKALDAGVSLNHRNVSGKSVVDIYCASDQFSFQDKSRIQFIAKNEAILRANHIIGLFASSDCCKLQNLKEAQRDISGAALLPSDKLKRYQLATQQDILAIQGGNSIVELANTGISNFCRCILSLNDKGSVTPHDVDELDMALNQIQLANYR